MPLSHWCATNLVSYILSFEQLYVVLCVFLLFVVGLREKTFYWVIALHDCLFLISGSISGMLMACELTNEIKIRTKRTFC